MPRSARRLTSNFCGASRNVKVKCHKLALIGVTAPFLTSCATFGQLDGPPAWCTVPFKKITCKAGDDLVQCYAALKQENDRERSKRRCLARYARAVSQP